ncbi:MAG: hypothetical protein IT426_19255 [Pirellulales bacterium]|nr:hypothetical protein [Pirellulales bacterium]
MKRRSIISLLLGIFGGAVALAALIVPNEVQQPGTQPGGVSNIEAPTKCDNCHGGYNTAVEPAHNWRGSMMSQATRDPIFWATVAVAEQDFDGVGDLCIRCHTPDGWIGGRSTPTDGSALAAGDIYGVSCDSCHTMTNPDKSEHLGVQTAPFLANDEANPPTGYYGGGMYVLWPGSDKLGPYSDAQATHKVKQSRFHRSVDYCGTCHDVSNPAVGDLAQNNGAQLPLPPGSFSGQLGTPVTAKAAFNNFPYQYGIVERTYSEYKAGLLSQTRVSNYATLPLFLRQGAIKKAYDNSIVAGTGGNYADGSPRYFSCQTCHMPPVTGQGCNKNPPVRKDLPLHDMTGGNYWIPDAIQYLDSQGKLRIGGGLSAQEKNALNAGKTRAKFQLNNAAALELNGNILRVYNLTGHKLISGYPEGRRMWLNLNWYDGQGQHLREDGAYGPMTVTIGGASAQVETILNPNDPNTKIYEAHYAITKDWAQKLLSVGLPSSLPLGYNRATGAVTHTLGELAQGTESYRESFHFVLNNYVAKDNRIPPYGMDFDEAAQRNTLPVPANQYGDPGPGGQYDCWDEIVLNPPAGASNVVIELLYQPTSWEYIQFLYLANTKQNAFLANEGDYLLEAWLATGMATPYVMTSGIFQVVPSGVAGRQVFYNNSRFDGASDDAAIASDKQALLPGQTAAFKNFTSYSRGINGIMVDIHHLPAGTFGLADFTFKVGNDNLPGAWAIAPAPQSIAVQPGGGVGGSDRVKIIWADNAILNQWLQVTVKAANTGLAQDDVFYFGNLPGESGDNAIVELADEEAARNHRSGFTFVPLTNAYDYNRDGQVNATDDLIARYNLGAALWPLAAPAAAANLPASDDPEAAIGGDEGSGDAGGIPIKEETPANGRPNRGQGKR